MAATASLMADVEGVNMQNDAESGTSDLKNDFAYHNNVLGAAKHVRMGFLRKVYSLLGMQLVLTTIIAGVCMGVPQIKEFVHANPWILLLAFVLSLTLLVLCSIKRRESPMNLILLAAFVSINENINRQAQPHRLVCNCCLVCGNVKCFNFCEQLHTTLS